MNSEENFSNWQSAVSGIQAENISIGDINQSIINSSSTRYNHIGVIVSEYNRKIAKLEKSYKDRIRFDQKNLYKQLHNYLKELEKKIEEYQQTIEHSQQILKQGEATFKTTAEIVKSSKDHPDPSLWNLANTLAAATAAAYFIHGDSREISKSIKEAEQKKAETEKDIDEFKPLIKLVEGFLRINILDLDIDQVLDNKSLSDFSSSSREGIEFIKNNYKAQKQELEDSYNQDFVRYKTEKNTNIYREELQYCLDEDGYPLSKEKIRFLDSRLRSFELDKEEAESIAKEIVKPLAAKYLKEYEEAYKDRLSKERFPVGEDSVNKLKELKEALGLNTFSFLGLETQVIEKSLVRLFYQSNFQEYRRNYRQKLEERGLLISSEDVIQLDKLQISLGLKAFTFEDLGIRKAEQELIELVYRANIKKYEQQYKQKLKQEGFPLNLATISELAVLEQNLSLGSFQFQDCPEPATIRRQLIEPIYQTNLQSYSKAYKQSLYQFGVNFSQKNTTELEKLRGAFGLDVSYLEKLGLQDLLNLEEIRKIEAEQEEIVYREHIQSFELEYMRRLDKEGFSLSYSTISELSHLEEVLGLGSFQFQDCPEPAAIKEELLKPYYQANLQNYGKEYKKKLHQLGLNLAENHAPEVEKLRNNFGLNSAHLKNLGLQDKFMLEDDLSAVEKTVKDSVYEAVLQCYAQEFSREVEIGSCLVEQSNAMKESIQVLGIRGEDIKVVEGLIKNNWSIEHLFHERNSEVSYWKLISFLAEHEWQKADILTRNLLLKLVDRSDKGFLDKGSVEKISAKDVYTLDRLWVDYSSGLFGFSIQKKILDRVEQKKQPFAEAVGWSNQAGLFKGIFAWKSYNELDFTLNAPKGHLPVWRVKGKEISVDDFSHLKIWDFKRNEAEPELEASITEDLSLTVSDTDKSKSDSSTTNILLQSFQKIFESINQFEIKEKVDKMGIDGFINQCAILAATTGAASGFGGFTTMIVGVPFDVLNNVLQQFRVTLGVIYYKKGVYKVSFTELIKIVGISVGVEVGATLTKSVMINLANKILVRLSASVAGKAVPFLGAAIGGSVNYGFVKAIGAAVKRIDMSSYTFQSEESGGEIEGQ